MHGNRRRDFITLLGGAAAWPIAVRAQQLVTTIGYLDLGSSEPRTHLVAAFRKGLFETGYIEGQNVAIEYRWADGQYDRLPSLASDLVRRQVSVIAALGGSEAALAAKAATSIIPIVFNTGSDPIRTGLVSRINRPEGNVTGVSYFTQVLGAKRLNVLRELLPAPGSIGVLTNPANPVNDFIMRELQAAAQSMGQPLSFVHAASSLEIDEALATVVQKRTDALLVSPDPLFTSRRVQLVTLTTRYAIPTMFTSREFADAGGLMSYGANLAETFRQVGEYVGKILKGSKPAELPVVQPTKFEFVINLQTAKALRITVPATVLALADEVIE